MVWRHYETRQSGTCEVQATEGNELTRFNIGLVETGTTRVFAGHFVRLLFADHDPITGEDAHSLRAALRRLAHNIEPLGLTLNCAGLSPKFSESGLSVDTGWGYWGPRSEPIHMMDPMPPTEQTDDLDDMIREAVDGLRIGIGVTVEPVPQQPVRGAPRKAARGRATHLSGHRAPFGNRGPAYSMRNAPRTRR